MTNYTQTPDEVIERIESAGDKMRRVREAAERIIFGQREVIEQTLVTILSGGHALLIGVPGLGKTRLVETLGGVLGVDAKRIQFTPDLMPSDIIGSEVLEEGAGGRSFRFLKGPIFAQLLMADEINRASPKTQSALLQAMQEHHVTVAGQRHDVPAPFHVLATQNPLEQEGTYPLPEAQLDRFLLQIDVGYPDEAAERRMLHATTGLETATIVPVIAPEELLSLQRLVRQIPVGDKVVDAILKLVRAARPGTGAGPGGRQAHLLGSGTPRQPGLDAGGPCPRHARRALGTLGRRRRGARRARLEASHGAHLRGPHRGPGHRRRHQEHHTDARLSLPREGAWRS